jgi:hypothetical protein
MNTTRLKFMFLEEPWNLELGTRPRCFPSSPGVPAFAPYPSHMNAHGGGGGPIPNRLLYLGPYLTSHLAKRLWGDGVQNNPPNIP